MPRFKFIDLFAGIGGFHQAMTALDGKCVFACDINKDCRKVYKQNFCKNNEFPVEDDINKFIGPKAIPEFDVLCGGFHCQTFSKAGNRTGFSEEDSRGQLFYRIIDILENHPECKYVFLENVRNLADDEDNWNIVCTELKNQGYVITEKPIIESPENFGIPQTRERVYILGIKREFIKGLTEITREDLRLNSKKRPFNGNCIDWIKDENTDKKYYLNKELTNLLNIWEEFLQELQRTNSIKSPFWLPHIGYNYNTDLEFILSYDWKDIPDWKRLLIFKSRIMYTKNRNFINEWINKYDMFNRLLIHQKFEWNASVDCNSIRQGIIQIRQSGVRVKSPSVFPSLVAMSNIPIIWDNNIRRYRYLSVHECAKLQSFNSKYKFSENDSISYRQLGNSVNVKVIKIIAQQLFKLGGYFNEV